MFTPVEKYSSGVQWFDKLKSSNVGDADVTLTTVLGSNKAEHFAITFRNKVWSVFKSDYVLIGLDGARICFVGSDKKSGYKLSNPSGNYSRYVKSSNKILVEFARTHKGDYPLHYDSEQKFWYIDTTKEV